MDPYYDQDGITIYHGDCREIMPALHGLANAVITDPPYAISVKGSSCGRRLDFFTGDDDWPAMIATVRSAIKLARERLTQNGSIYAWISHRQIGPLVEDLELSGMSTRFLVWVKSYPTPPPPGAGWPSGAELCLYAYPPGRTWTHTSKDPPRSNVFVADTVRTGRPGKHNHPTQKPTCVIRPLIRASTLPGDLILDPFAGSGTTLVTAREEGRRAIGIEIEERYCEIAAQRLLQNVMRF